MEYEVERGFLFKMVGFCCGILVILFSYSNGAEPECEQCGCCVNKECSTQYVNGHHIDDYCTRGCIVGYGGNRCYNKCPDDCVTCEQYLFRNCATCDERKYVNDDKRCVDCPKNCKMCTSATRCQECYPLYYNDGSKQDCSLSCPGNCLCGNLGVCSSCQDGFFNMSNTCRNACPDTCKTCTDQSHCQSCQPLYSGDMCCLKDGHCSKCSSSTDCDKCTDGYYGIECDASCPKTCHNSRCDRKKGICLGCEEGFHGDYCSKDCNEGCINDRCNQENGHCSEGCKDGLHGDHCDRICSERCMTERCMQENGSCTDGCKPGFEGPTCSQKLHEDRTSSEIGTVVGIGVIIVVIIVTIVIAVTIIIVRRWKTNFLRKYSDTANSAGYVNTQLQTTPIDVVDVCVNNDQIDQSEYERLGERNDKQRDEYDQITSVNQ